MRQPNLNRPSSKNKRVLHFDGGKMIPRAKRPIILLSIALIFTSILLIFGIWIAYGRAPSAGATPEAWYGVDPIFQRYYQFLGKERVMGVAISPAYQEGTKKVQYLENGKMVFDEAAPTKSLFTLAPLGRHFGLIEPSLPPPPIAENSVYVNGHYIAPEFQPLYQQLLPENVGKPLTEIRYNPIYRRYEQFFENLGFYHLEGSDEVRLLAYGVWACGTDCRVDHIVKDARIDLHPQIDPTFTQFISQMGTDFTGFALAQARFNREGKWEQVFEKVVLTANSPNNAGGIELRKLPRDTNVIPDPPRANRHTPNGYFYEIPSASTSRSNKGYEIPDYFWAYITRHGGLAITGIPITHLSSLTPTVLRQCFENLCLMYDPQLPSQARVSPEPLGYTYKLLYYSEPTRTATPVLAPPTLHVWERYPVASTNLQQELGVSVLRLNQPVAGVIPFVKLTLPNGEQKTLAMPATDANGISTLTLPPIQAINGTLILYQVCLPSFGDRSCAGDSYVIWNTR
jgi:hypothetical protein